MNLFDRLIGLALFFLVLSSASFAVEASYSDFPSVSRGYIPFSKVSYTFKTSKVIIVLPRQDETTLAMYHSAEALSTELQYKYGANNTYLLGGVEIVFSDNPFLLNCGSRDELKRSTLILIGNEENNDVIACLPWNREPDMIAITRNTWSDQLDYAYVIDSDDPEMVDGFTQILKNDLFSNTQVSLISLVKFVSSDIPLPYSDMNLNFSDVPGVCGHFSDTYAHKDIDYLTGAWCTMNETRNVVVMLPVAPGIRYKDMPLKQEMSDFVIGAIWGSSGEDYYEGNLPYLAGNILHSFSTVGNALDLRYDYFQRRDTGRSLLDAVGLIPAIGAIKNYDKFGKIIKDTEKVSDASKELKELSNDKFLAENLGRAIENVGPEKSKEVISAVYGKDADSLRSLLKSKGYSDTNVDLAFSEYINAGYNLKDIQTAIDAKDAIASMSEAEKISHLDQLFGGKVSRLKSEYGFSNADVLKISDKGVPVGAVYDKLVDIQQDKIMSHAMRTSARTAEAIKGGAIEVDQVSTLSSSEVLYDFEEALGTNPLTGGEENKLVTILSDSKGTQNILVHGEEDKVEGVTLLTHGTSGGGWLHILLKHILGSQPNGDLFKTLFPEIEGSEEVIVKQWIQKAIKTGNPIALKAGQDRIGYILEPYNDGRKIAVVVEYKFYLKKIGVGPTQSRIITAYPCIRVSDCFELTEKK